MKRSNVRTITKLPIKKARISLLEYKIKKRVKAENTRPILLDEAGMFLMLSRLKPKALIEDKRN